MTLTDYDRLAEYVPNLTQSKVRPSNDGQIRLWQEGAQKIVGFDFRASVEMFMDEHFGESFPLCQGNGPVFEKIILNYFLKKYERRNTPVSDGIA